MKSKKTFKITANVVKPKKKDKDYDKEELKEGEEVEKEHTTTKKLQKNIAKNHLDEDDNYYEKLEKLEKMKKGKKKK
mgnify:CR=1 FL=1